VALPNGELTCDLYLARLPADGTGLLQVVPMADPRHTARALRQSEKRLQAILDNVPALVYVKDREGRYVYMNRRCQEKFAIAAGMVDSQWAPAGVAAHYVAHDREVLELGAAREFHEVVHEDGCDRRYISLKFPLFDDQGVPYAVAGFSTDITAVKDAEAAAERAREAAESANRAKSEFSRASATNCALR
jgi:PAS domain S-box-containing protein